MATGASVTSYLFHKAETLTKIQAGPSCLWIIHGIGTGTVPVVVANVIVVAVALYSLFRRVLSQE